MGYNEDIEKEKKQLLRKMNKMQKLMNSEKRFFITGSLSFALSALSLLLIPVAELLPATLMPAGLIGVAGLCSGLLVSGCVNFIRTERTGKYKINYVKYKEQYELKSKEYEQEVNKNNDSMEKSVNLTKNNKMKVAVNEVINNQENSYSKEKEDYYTYITGNGIVHKKIYEQPAGGVETEQENSYSKEKEGYYTFITGNGIVHKKIYEQPAGGIEDAQEKEI